MDEDAKKPVTATEVKERMDAFLSCDDVWAKFRNGLIATLLSDDAISKPLFERMVCMLNKIEITAKRKNPLLDDVEIAPSGDIASELRTRSSLPDIKFKKVMDTPQS